MIGRPKKPVISENFFPLVCHHRSCTWFRCNAGPQADCTVTLRPEKPMANPEHLEILKKGVEIWKRWRDYAFQCADCQEIFETVVETTANHAPIAGWALLSSNLILLSSIIARNMCGF